MPEKFQIGILGVGRCLPEMTVTNKHHEKIVNTSDEWILQRTGIRERRIISGDETLLGITVESAKEALKSAGISKDKIGYIRIGVNTHNRFPSLATMVQRELKIKNASASDISAGCSAFIFSVEETFNNLYADWMLRGEENYGLVIGADALSLITDWTDRSTCVLFGDGAGAVVLGPSQSNLVLATHTRSQGEYTNLLYLDEYLRKRLTFDENEQPIVEESQETNYPFLRMEGRKVFPVAVRTMMADIRTVIEKYNKMNGSKLTVNDIDYVIPHQANLRIVAAVQEGLKLKQDQVYREGVINYGNSSAATIPIGYVDEWNKRPGAIEIDVAFGAGFASGAILRKVGG